jgi:hypothetical protein
LKSPCCLCVCASLCMSVYQPIFFVFCGVRVISKDNRWLVLLRIFVYFSKNLKECRCLVPVAGAHIRYNLNISRRQPKTVNANPQIYLWSPWQLHILAAMIVWLCNYYYQAEAKSTDVSGNWPFLHTSYWFLAWLTLRSWGWRRHVPPKRRLNFTKLHDVIFRNILTLMTIRGRAV